jgi:hypothetical protein
VIWILIVFVATPMTQMAAPTGTTSGVGNQRLAIALVVIGALNRFAVPEDGNKAAVPVPQFVPVPVWTAYVPLVVVVVWT